MACNKDLEARYFQWSQIIESFRLPLEKNLENIYLNDLIMWVDSVLNDSKLTFEKHYWNSFNKRFKRDITWYNRKKCNQELLDIVFDLVMNAYNPRDLIEASYNLLIFMLYLRQQTKKFPDKRIKIRQSGIAVAKLYIAQLQEKNNVQQNKQLWNIAKFGILTADMTNSNPISAIPIKLHTVGPIIKTL
ncbi:hypothetical protein CEXT_630331 [Caerostris extrusa]|uniref:Uncharacterized protein n=1 Tax=Caerostris extrusa TaxID=172846 RepID=A0AAV4QIV9_CAEEX|nr:hypothetical protein CEXT_630331 [Caerostris extrusa]